jgi:uncharacterized membrane protein YphA (DoxX/SURF4 family)
MEATGSTWGKRPCDRKAKTMTDPTAIQASGRRAANVTLWCLQVVTAAVFVFAAVPKVTADPQAVAGFDAMGLGNTGMYLIGTAELAGAVGLLIPVLCGLAALALVGLMIGAVIITVLLFGVGPLVALPAGVLVLVAIIAWGRRRRTARLFALAQLSVHQ